MARVLTAATWESQDRTIVRLLFLFALLLCFAYGYFLVSSVVDTLLHKEYRRSAARLESTVSVAEAAYMKETTVVDRSIAEAAGFVPAPPPKFLSKSAPSDGVTLNH